MTPGIKSIHSNSKKKMAFNRLRTPFIMVSIPSDPNYESLS